MSPDAELRGDPGGREIDDFSAGREPGRRGRLVALVSGLVVVVTGLALGPRPSFDERWVEPALPVHSTSAVGASLSGLADHLADAEARVPGVRPGDQREIVWADPDAPAPTAVALVYLHGFSADRHEIEPVVSELGEELGANVYFARLTGHGRDGPAMAEATAADWLDDTVEAIAIGHRLGDRVVLVGTSTGAGRFSAKSGQIKAGARRICFTTLPDSIPKEDRLI